MDSTCDQDLLLPKEERELIIKTPTSQKNIKENLKNIAKDLLLSKNAKKKKLNNYLGEGNDEVMPNPISEIFLKIVYPLTVSMDKSIMIGVFKSLDFTPGILLTHNGKSVLFSEHGWNSFNKNMNLVQCYLINKVYGKKTSIRLTESNVEIDNVKIRSAQGVRFRDLTKYDSKVVLNDKEFSVMIAVTPAINRYLEQLVFCGPVVKDYLTDAICKQPNLHLIYGPIDTSIYNRLPQEVDLFRSMLSCNTDEEPEDEDENGVIKVEDEEEEQVGDDGASI